MSSPSHPFSAPEQVSPRPLPAWLSVLVLLLAVAAPLWHLHIIDRHMSFQKNDLVSRWIGTRDALHGMDPYSPAVTREIQTAYYGRPLTSADRVDGQEFFYPAYLVLLLAPLTWVPWHIAHLIFFLGLLPLLAGSFWLCIRSLDLPLTRRRTAMIVFLAFASWPVMWGLRLQQLTLLVAVFIFTACFLLKRGYAVPAGILLGVSIIKPQLILPLLMWLLAWAFFQRLWSFIASFVCTVAILLAWTEMILPNWFSHWRQGLAGYGLQHVLPLQSAFGHWTGLVLTALLVAWGAFVLWQLRRCPAGSPEFMAAISLALAIAVSATPAKLPFIYNEVVLLPACVILLYTKSTGRYVKDLRLISVGLLIWGFSAIIIAVLGESAFGPSAFWDDLPYLNYVFPVFVTITLAAIYTQTSSRLARPLTANSLP